MLSKYFNTLRKTNNHLHGKLLGGFIGLFLMVGWFGQAYATAFTYQGQLKDISVVVTDSCNIKFDLFSVTR